MMLRGSMLSEWVGEGGQLTTDRPQMDSGNPGDNIIAQVAKIVHSETTGVASNLGSLFHRVSGAKSFYSKWIRLS